MKKFCLLMGVFLMASVMPMTSCGGNTPTAPSLPGLPVPVPPSNHLITITGLITDQRGNPLPSGEVMFAGMAPSGRLTAPGGTQDWRNRKAGETYTVQAFSQHYYSRVAAGYLNHLPVWKSFRWDGKTNPVVLNFQLKECAQPGTAMCGTFRPTCQ